MVSFSYPIRSTTNAGPRDLEITGDGKCRPMIAIAKEFLEYFPYRKPYRLYRFLSDLDDIVNLVTDDLQRIRLAAVLTRRFLSQESSAWIFEACPVPDPETFSAGHILYQEPGYPFVIMLTSWLPQCSPVHSHGNWSIVACLGDETTGREQNYFWQRLDDGSTPGYAKVKVISKEILKPGDIIGFTADAIHNIKSISSEGVIAPKPTYLFNIFGETDEEKCFQFNPFNDTVEKL